MREWFATSDLAGLPGLPGTRQGVLQAAKRQQWKSRRRWKGKGLEYHISSLPLKTRAALGDFGDALSAASDQPPASRLVILLARLLRPVVLEILRQEIRDA
jgi:hypothetical protein